MKSMYYLFLVLLSSFAQAGQSPAAVTLTKDNVITINNVFLSDTAANVIKQAKDLDARLVSSDPIYLVINSPGGSIEAGLELIENLSHLNRKVHTINLFSASMGFQTAQGLGERYVTKNGTMMSHKARGMFSGEFPGQLDSRYGHYMKRVLRMDELTVKRTHGKHTLKSYHNLIENEYWCDGEDCVSQGFADNVVTTLCDKSLDGTTPVAIFQDILMGMSVEVYADFDNCPTNTNALKYRVLINGQPIFKNNLKVVDDKKQVYGPQPQPYSPYSGYSSSWFGSVLDTPSYTDPLTSISKEDLRIIKEKTDAVIEKNKEQRQNVYKGY